MVVRGTSLWNLTKSTPFMQCQTLDVFPCQSNQSSHLFMKIRKHCFYVCRTLLDKILHHLRCKMNSVESELILHINQCNHWISEASAVLLVSFTKINPLKTTNISQEFINSYMNSQNLVLLQPPFNISTHTHTHQKNKTTSTSVCFRESSWAPLDAAASTSTNPRPTGPRENAGISVAVKTKQAFSYSGNIFHV